MSDSFIFEFCLAGGLDLGQKTMRVFRLAITIKIILQSAFTSIKGWFRLSHVDMLL